MINIIALSVLSAGFFVQTGSVSAPSSNQIDISVTESGLYGASLVVENDDTVSMSNFILDRGLTFGYSNNGTFYTLANLTMPTATTWKITFNTSYLINYTCRVNIQTYFTNGSGYVNGGVYHLYDSSNTGETYTFVLPSGSATNGMAFALELYPQDADLVNAYDNRNADIQEAFDNGVQQGYLDYQDSGEYQDYITEVWHDGYDDGRAYGWQEGYDEALTQDVQTATVFNGILSIALLPINVFLGMMNFEVFGINVGGFVSGLLTIAIIFILFRTIFNGGSKDAD